MLLWTFAAAGVYTLVSSHVAWLKSFPVFTWVGLPAVTAWGWDVTPSMGYIGQVGALLLSLRFIFCSVFVYIMRHVMMGQWPTQ